MNIFLDFYLLFLLYIEGSYFLKIKKIFYTTNRNVRYGINYQASSPTARPGTSFSITPSDKKYRTSGVGLSGATSWATRHVSGMEGIHNIEVSVRF